MKIHRFFVNTGFCKGEMNISDIDVVHQIKSVLKLHSGELCVLFNAAHEEARVRIVAYEQEGVLVHVLEIIQQDIETKKIILYCAILKRENFEWVVQKATELGVYEIVPLITQRTVKTGLRRSRLEKIAIEASEQSGRVRIPSIHEPMIYAEALDRAQDHDYTVVLHTQSEQTDGIEKKSYKTIGLFVGPEGGFTDEEIAEAKKYNYAAYTFPNMVLRAETAAIVGVFWARDVIS